MNGKAGLTPRAIIQAINNRHEDMKKFGVRKIGLFGSFCEGTPHKGSDLDFLVAFDEPTFDNYMDLRALLEKMFHKKVDLVIEENLKPALRYVKKGALYA
jgi:hypothetical protein